MRKLIGYFIKHSVAVNIVVIAFIIFGFFGAVNLKSSFFPLTDSKNISINVIYPGASPQEVEEGIILKIEDNLKGLNGVERVTSTSRENSGNINVEIEKGKDNGNELTKGTHHNDAQTRALLGRHRPESPARLRRFT